MRFIDYAKQDYIYFHEIEIFALLILSLNTLLDMDSGRESALK